MVWMRRMEATRSRRRNSSSGSSRTVAEIVAGRIEAVKYGVALAGQREGVGAPVAGAGTDGDEAVIDEARDQAAELAAIHHQVMRQLGCLVAKPR